MVRIMPVNNHVLDFDNLLEQVFNGVFNLNIPPTFKKIEWLPNPPARDEMEQVAATGGRDKEVNGGNKRKQKKRMETATSSETICRMRMLSPKVTSHGRTRSLSNSLKSSLFGKAKSKCV